MDEVSSSAAVSGLHGLLDLTGRVAVITGATKNIGFATAKLFAEAGALLVLTARTADRLAAVANEIEQRSGRTVLAMPGDVTDLTSMDTLAAAALDRFGGVDIVVNNAFVDMGHQPMVDASSEIWSDGLRGYIEGPHRLIRALRESMTAGGRGAVVNMVSTAAFSPLATLGAYGVMKAAMWSATRYLARELAPSIRVNAVCPGTTREGADPGESEVWRSILPTVPLQRMGRPEETAAAALFLASGASAYTTGQVLFVDGGRVSLSGAAA